MLTDNVTLEKENGWTPVVALDIMATTQSAFEEKAREFYRLTRDRALRPNFLTTGWHTITPEMAEELLLGKANRKISSAHVQYLARQMLADGWVPTGQPVIITADGIMRDAYHRCWACYLSGKEFSTFVVTNVENTENIFAFIDNCKVRTLGDALATAGFNGISPTMAATARIAIRYEVGFYEPMRRGGRTVLPKMTPNEMLRFAGKHPTMHDAIHTIVSEHKGVIKDLLPRKKDVACFVGWQIHDRYGEDVLEDFFTELDGEDVDGPLGLLRTKLIADVECRNKLSVKEVLAFCIKTFNAWYGQKPMRRLILGTDEAFPRFVTAAEPADPTDDDEPSTGDQPEQQPNV